MFGKSLPRSSSRASGVPPPATTSTALSLLVIPGGISALSPFPQQIIESDAQVITIGLDGRIMSVKPDLKEKQHFDRYRLPTMIWNVIKSLPTDIYNACFYSYKIEHTNSDIEYYLSHTVASRLIKNDPANGQPVINLMHYERLSTFPEFYLHGLKLFLKKDSENSLRLDRIHIAGSTVTSDDKNWDLAKLHFLAALGHEGLFVAHGSFHVVSSTIQYIMKKSLSLKNPIRLFLMPHFSYDTALSDTLLDSFSSTATNATALPIQSVRKLLNKGLSNYTALPNNHDTPYSCLEHEAYNVIHEHVSGFVEKNRESILEHFEEIRIFFDEVHNIVACYPNGKEITLYCLKDLISQFVYAQTFAHSIDHNTNSSLGVFRFSFRIRQPFSTEAAWNMKSLIWPRDTFKGNSFKAPFGTIPCDKLLYDVEYDASLDVDTNRLKTRLDGLELKNPAVFSKNLISCFIDK